jgi:hypothetical protein
MATRQPPQSFNNAGLWHAIGTAGLSQPSASSALRGCAHPSHLARGSIGLAELLERDVCRTVACNLILEYTLSAAAVARGFSSYLATLMGLGPTAFIIKAGILNIDFPALALVRAHAPPLASGRRCFFCPCQCLVCL